MQEIVIDFKKYSSIKIGAKLPVKVFETDDVGAHFESLKSPEIPEIKKNYENSESIKRNTNARNIAVTENFENLKNLVNHKNTTNSENFVNDKILKDEVLQNPKQQNKDQTPHKDMQTKKPKIYENTSLVFDKILMPTENAFLQLDSKLATKWRIVGKGNNILVSPHAKNLAILGNSFNYISCNQDSIEIGSSVNSLQAFLFFKRNNFCGLEFLKDLPGNIGALCNMNAGMKQYEMSQSLQSLNINGEWVGLQKAKLLYRKRNSGGVIFAARFHKKDGFRHDLLGVFSQMRKTHPKEPSCGSCFKNPPNDYAGRLLEMAGMKGFMINQVGFSHLHANFLVNHGEATYEDALKVIELAKQKVYDLSGVWLECEVQICK